MVKKLKPYIISILLALSVGGLSALLTRKSMNIYDEFKNKEDAERWIRENNISNSKGGAIHTHIVEVCKGKRKTAYGYKWKYTD